MGDRKGRKGDLNLRVAKQNRIIVRNMKRGNIEYYIENREIRSAEVLKASKGFVTLRYRYKDHDSDPRKTVYHYTGLRLKTSKVFETEKETERI